MTVLVSFFPGQNAGYLDKGYECQAEAHHASADEYSPDCAHGRSITS